MAAKLSPTDAAKNALDTAIKAAELFLAGLDAAQAEFPPAEPGITLAGEGDIASMKQHLGLKLQEMRHSRSRYEPVQMPQALEGSLAGNPLP